MRRVLTPHQRRVAVALLIDEIPIDVLAERMETNRNALYKALHDARVKLRAELQHNAFLHPPNRSGDDMSGEAQPALHCSDQSLTAVTEPWLSCDELRPDRHVRRSPRRRHRRARRTLRVHLANCPACYDEAESLISPTAEDDDTMPALLATFQADLGRDNSDPPARGWIGRLRRCRRCADRGTQLEAPELCRRRQRASMPAIASLVECRSSRRFRLLLAREKWYFALPSLRPVCAGAGPERPDGPGVVGRTCG